MEVLEVSGYVSEEKSVIARRYLGELDILPVLARDLRIRSTRRRRSGRRRSSMRRRRGGENDRSSIE
jgi:hypothetical protein